MEVIVITLVSVCLNIWLVLISGTTSCMQDFSQLVVAVADHISHSSSFQWFHCHHDCFVCCLCVCVKEVQHTTDVVTTYLHNILES